MLDACSNNLQLAIEMHMDGGEGATNNIDQEDPGLSIAGSSQKLNQQGKIDESAMASTSSTDSQLNTGYVYSSPDLNNQIVIIEPEGLCGYIG